MIYHHPSYFVRQFCPDALWRKEGTDGSIYLTFDDGPIPESTPWLLETLGRYNVQATFFVVGNNVRCHPNLFFDIVRYGHDVGNHTFHHLNRLHCTREEYLTDIRLCDEQIAQCMDMYGMAYPSAPSFFRPPHGLLDRRTSMMLEGKKIVQWDVVTRDYSPRMDASGIIEVVKHYSRSGSIITMHDSLKSIEKLRTALPACIELLQERGFVFKKLSDYDLFL